jgi:hypothetical protein
VGALFGCSGDTVGVAPTVTSQTPFGITLNQHAINLALTPPHDQFQLIATVVNVDGAPLTDSSTITYRTTDSSVTVSASGLITPQSVTQSGLVQVIATRRNDGIVFSDTAFVRVTATAPASPLATFSIQPTSGDSAVRPVNSSNYTPTVQAANTAGQSVEFNNQSGTIFWMRTSDRSRFPYINGSFPRINYTDTGHVTIYATSWAYGVALRDSLRFLVGWPLLKTTYYDPDNGFLCNFFNACNFVLGKGGGVVWSNSADESLRDVVFDDSLAVDSTPNYLGQYTGRGNLHFAENGGYQELSRSFPKAGIYHWHDVRNPAGVGTILVEENPSR